ncbi:hypothetical protein ACUHMQ_11180 [Chitinimonas sp. PSY-7]|uniref:hypothetical protein n=1 Tax=Chitinimonas sp. PSY-7 TaxID=3459088 RepID=UPI0040400589
MNKLILALITAAFGFAAVGAHATDAKPATKMEKKAKHHKKAVKKDEKKAEVKADAPKA